MIIAKIRRYIQDCGGFFRNWYVGISNSPRVRLFVGHNVQEDRDPWIYVPAASEAIAREAERFFINVLETDGGPGGGINPNYVYAYRKTHDTKP